MSLNCFKEGTPHKSSNCRECGKCLHCWDVDCIEDHRGSPIGKQGKEIRRKKEQARRERDGGLSVELRGRDEKNLNEDVLAKPIIETITELEALQHERVLNPVGKLASRVGISVSHRLEERKTAISESALDSPRICDDACKMLTDILHQMAGEMTDSKKAQEKLVAIFRERVSLGDKRRHVTTSLVDSFIRSTDRVKRREHFAHLCKNLTSDVLCVELELGKQRALKDSRFKEERKGHFYGRSDRQVASGSVDSSDSSDSDDSEENSSDANDDSEENSSHANDDTTRRKGKKVFVSLEQELDGLVRWGKSMTRRVQAGRDWVRILEHKPLMKTWSRCRVKPEAVRSTLHFIMDQSLGWKGGKTRNVDICGETLDDLPYLNMSLSLEQLWHAYQEEGKRGNNTVFDAPMVGRDTFRKLLNSCSRRIAEKHALSYYYTDAIEAMDWLLAVIERLEKLLQAHNDVPPNPSFFEEFTAMDITFSEVKDLHKEMVTHMKYGIRQCLNIKENCCDNNRLHCARFAVGAPCSKAHNKIDTCVPCLNFAGYARLIHKLANSIKNGLAREQEAAHNTSVEEHGGAVHEIGTMMPTIIASGNTINLFHKHIIRGVWQSKAWRELQDELPVGTAAIILDHKQKIEPVNFNESSEKYYGKKGISLLGAAVLWREQTSDPLRHQYIDTVVCKSKQDAIQVQTVLESVLVFLKTKLLKSVKRVVLVSDNGASLSNKLNIQYVWSRNKSMWDADLFVERWLFFESQCGKTILDTHFSFVGIMIRNFARSVRAVSSHRDVFDACKNDGGIEKTSTVLLDFERSEAEKDDEDDEKSSVAVTGIRKTHDVFFENDLAKLFDHTGAGVQSTVKYKVADVMEKKKYVIVESFMKVPTKETSAKTSTESQSPVQSQSPQATKAESNPSPLTRMLCSEIRTFTNAASSRGKESRLHVDPSSLATEKGKKSKQSSVVEDGNDLEFRACYDIKWSEPAQRKLIPLPSALETKLEEMVRDM